MKRLDTPTFGSDIEFFLSKIPPPEKEAAELKALEKAYVDMETRMANNDLSHSEFSRFVEISSKMKKFRSNPYPKVRSHANIVPCVGLIDGTKDKHFIPKGWPEGFALHEDNVSLELTIPVCEAAKEFAKAIRTGLTLTQDYIIKEHNLCINRGTQWHEFTNTQLLSGQAKTFGCEPDYNAYQMGQIRDLVPDFGKLRTAGAHIHIGGDFKCPDWVAALFLELYLYTYVDNKILYKSTDKRMKWYGQPGIFRSKPYGIEYRSLGNFWVNSNPLLNSIAPAIEEVAKFLIRGPAQVLQRYFREVDWLKLQRLVHWSYPNTAAGRRQGNNDRSLLHAQSTKIMWRR